MAAFDQSPTHTSPSGEDAVALPNASESEVAARMNSTGAALVTVSLDVLEAIVARKVAEALDRRQAFPGRSGGPGAVSTPEAMAETVGIREIVAFMPVGLRSDASVRRGIKTGRFPAKKIGARWCLSPQAVLAALAKEGLKRAGHEQFNSHWEATRKIIKDRPTWPRKITRHQD